MGSSASSLCTFLPTFSPSAGFAQGYHAVLNGEGFPEFTRSFNHGLPWKLQASVYSRSLYQLSYRGITPVTAL